MCWCAGTEVTVKGNLQAVWEVLFQRTHREIFTYYQSWD